MKKMNGIADGNIIASYTDGKHTWNCRISNGFYCATFNVRKTNVTYYSKDKTEINELIKEQLKKGFKKV